MNRVLRVLTKKNTVLTKVNRILAKENTALAKVNTINTLLTKQDLD